MKHVKHLLLLAALLLGSLTASAEKVEIDGIWYNLVSKAKVAEVTYRGDSFSEYDEYSGSITIPAVVSYNGVEYDVTGIREWAFAGCSNLTSITISKGVTTIGNSAFSGCNRLTSITIPESVTSIEIGAFSPCGNLAAVYISSLDAWCRISFGDSDSNPLSSANKLYLNGNLVMKLDVPTSVTAIKNFAFVGCTSLTSVTIPEGVAEIGESAFYGCSKLSSVKIPDSVTSIGKSAFVGCTSLTSVTIPNGVPEIGEDIFQGCSSLTSITIPKSVTSIGRYAFAYCSSLAEITIPEDSQLTLIGWGAFFWCGKLKSITLPKRVSSIEDLAFAGCSSLSEITIPSKVNVIDIGVFQECSNLSSVVLPKRLSKIDYCAFANCENLTHVFCNSQNPPVVDETAFDGAYINYVTLHVPTNALNSYKSTEPWSSFSTIVGEDDLGGNEEDENDGDENGEGNGGSGDGNGSGSGEGNGDSGDDDDNKDEDNEIDNKSAITSLSQLSNEVLYYISQPNHSQGITSWAVGRGGSELKSNVQLGIEPDASDARQQFAVISNDGGGTRYLYHVAEKKFVGKDGSLSGKPTDAIRFKDGAYANTFVAYFDASHYVNVGGSQQMTIDGWSTADGGNSCVILPVGEYNPSDALAAFGVAVTSVSLNKTTATLTEGETLTLTATVSPSNATDKTVTWSTSNNSVATVKNGKVTAKAVGTVVITAKAGTKAASCTVAVIAASGVDSVTVDGTKDIIYNLNGQCVEKMTTGVYIVNGRKVIVK